MGVKSNLLRSLLMKGIEIKCFKVIVSDITQINYSENKAYLCVHMDYTGKYILGWELSESTDQELPISSGKKAIKSLLQFNVIELSEIIFHQDRGSVYTSEGNVTLII